MIPPPLAIPLAYAPPPLSGWGLSSFPRMSPAPRNCPHKARRTIPLCDTLACGRRGCKRPVRERKRYGRCAPRWTTAQCAPTRHWKRPVYAPRPFPRPATRPTPTTRPSASIRSLPATGPPSLATGPPAPQISGFSVSPGKVRVRLAPPCARIPPGPSENRRRTYTGQNRRWKVAEIFREIRPAPSRRSPRPGIKPATQKSAPKSAPDLPPNSGSAILPEQN
jgi:hypothetical protein